MTDIKSPPESRILTAELHRLLVEWNNTTQEYPSDKCIHQLFEEQVERTPDAMAVVFEDQQLTYRELNNRANQLAHYLQKLGVGPDVLAGICVERSVEMVVGLLGILKAGGAYVPLDPAYPKERLAFMLHDSQAHFLVTQARIEDLMPSFASARIFLDRDWQEIARESAANVGQRQDPDNLAYVIYTSGSTGKPKGVMIQHGSVVNFLASMAREPGLAERDILLAVTTLSFDMAGLEIYLPLTLGARVVLARREVAVDGIRLAKQLSECGATVMQATPSTWGMLLAVGWQGSRELKILCGGEALSDDLAKQLVYHCGSLWNMYGPTETTIWSAVQRVPAHVGKVTLGRPIANTQLYILDDNLQPASIGVLGELHIEGDGLARGYLNRPELTKEKFIANPFNTDPASRLYKTGDLARYLPDGNIEFLGRIDHQVKIRGHRIELGEIEATLRQHPSIRESIVLAREDSPGDRRLAAYVVAAPGSVPAAHELRGFLQPKLPEHMVPSIFMLLESLPLTPNGKVDRNALPAPDHARPELAEAYLPPRTSVEELLAQIWSVVLKLDKVGIHDNFFALGGDSLRATQIIARLRNVLNKELFLSDIFSNGTIAELANSLTHRVVEATAHSTEPIQPIGRSRHLPLSFSQERVWFIQQLHPSNVAYNFQSLLYFTGRLDVDALERSLSEIVRRHEIYRTTFPETDGNPIQDIHAPFPVSLPVLDLQELPDHEREAALQERITAEIQKPFDLNKLPLVRWTLIQFKLDEFVLIHVEQHLVHDGWSFNVFRHELLELYKAFSTGDGSPLPEATLQFADFAHWQRQWMKGENAKRQLTYWKRQLTGSPSTLALATDRPRPLIPSLRGAAPRFDISPALGDSLRALSRQRGVTLFMTMFSAFVALLYRYTQQDDICVGTGVGNRRWKESEGLIGMLVNNVVLRTNLAEDPRFVDLLAQVRAVTLDAFANEDIPFDHVVRALEIERDDSRNPIFQVMFSFHDAPLHEPTLPGLGFKCVEVISNRSAKFDLNVIVIPRPEQRLAARAGEGSTTLIWEYSSDLFEPDTIERMVGHFQTLLEGIVTNPEQRIGELPLLTESERHQLWVDFNDTKTDYPKDKCIQELFEAQAEKTPDAIALVFEDQQLTYRELNHRANQLAHYLYRLGVGPEVLVGICVERSIEMVVGLLGILKAGGAYVPFDPRSPTERLQFQLQEMQAPVLLTQDNLVQSFQQSEFSHRCSVVSMDRDWQAIQCEYPEKPRTQARSNNLAYVIYTSGSTGQPKGVQITHESLLNLVFWHHRAFSVTFVDRATQLAGPGFDAAVWELWPYLTVGASIHIPDETTRLDAASLRDWLVAQFITMSFVPTALAESLMTLEWPRETALRILLTGADKLRSYPPETLPFRVFNNYGPTECTVVATSGQVAPNAHSVRAPTIGRPIANTRVYILDPNLNPVPIGVVGEIYIGGDGVARGYLNRPELTEGKFICNPFSEDPGSRLYKTGDRARYLPDGNIEFLGRMDDQVKIRGYRVELGEIETVLGQHSSLREAVVLAREDSPGDRRLVAYAVAAAGFTPSVHELRSFLQQKLPEYMMPSVFMFLELLPLTPNGKLDRKALPVPDQTRPELEETFVAPRTPVEETLASIWAGVLKVDKVGIHDDFFELGGHSLLATQLISRIRETFKIDLPLRSLFEAPTIYGLAQRMQELGVKQDVMQETKITRLTREQHRV